MTRRATFALIAIALLAGACGDDSSEPRVLDGTAAEIYGGECVSGNGRNVTIYSGRTENLIEPVLEAFACETGTGVDVRWGASTDLALLIETEGDRSPADVFLSRSPGPVGFLDANDLLGTIGEEVLALVEPENRAEDGSWVGFSGRKRVLVYSTEDVAAGDLPGSVFDLTSEAWRGKVAIPAVNGSFIDWFTVFRDVHGNDVATEWLADMVANDATSYPNNRSIVEAAGRGEIEVGLVNHYYNYQEVAAAGDDHRALNHDFADDDIGSLLIITAATILSTSDNVEAAEDLLGYLLTAPVQEYFTNNTFEYPLAAGVDANDVLPPLTALEIGSVDFDALGGGFEETSRIIEASGILDQ